MKCSKRKRTGTVEQTTQLTVDKLSENKWEPPHQMTTNLVSNYQQQMINGLLQFIYKYNLA